MAYQSILISIHRENNNYYDRDDVCSHSCNRYGGNNFLASAPSISCLSLIKVSITEKPVW